MLTMHGTIRYDAPGKKLYGTFKNSRYIYTFEMDVQEQIEVSFTCEDAVIRYPNRASLDYVGLSVGVGGYVNFENLDIHYDTEEYEVFIEGHEVVAEAGKEVGYYRMEGEVYWNERQERKQEGQA